MLLSWRLTIRLKLNSLTIWLNRSLKICKKMLKHQPKKPLSQRNLRRRLSQKRRRPKRKAKKNWKRPKRRPLRRLLRRLKRKLMMKSQWTPLLSRPIHPLLPMPPKILSHKLQLSTTRLLLSMMRSQSTPLPRTFTTQTQWDPWSKTRFHQSRMLQSKPPRRKTSEHWQVT